MRTRVRIICSILDDAPESVGGVKIYDLIRGVRHVQGEAGIKLRLEGDSGTPVS